MKRTWTIEQENLLIKEYPTAEKKRIRELFPDKSDNSIKSKATKLGLKKAVPRFRFTPEQLSELARIYPNTLNSDLAVYFGCSKHTIENKAFVLKLKKNAGFISKIAKERSSDPNHGGRKSRFKKGHAPTNKGKKQTDFMTLEAIEKSKASRFKKGHIPVNAVPVGYERVDKDGYVYIKVEGKRKLVMKHRHIWEQHNGEIPKGCNIQFKDGNRQNCSIENLYIVSRRKQMLNNSGALNLPDSMVALYIAGQRGKNKELIREIKNNHPELIQLKRQQIMLNRKIKEKI